MRRLLHDSGVVGLVSGASRLAACAIVALCAACSASPILSRYAIRVDEEPQLSKRARHPGVDFRAHIGAPVLAAAPGVIAAVGETDAGGGVVLVRHDPFGRFTAYAHLHWGSDTRPVVGRRVGRGDVLGIVGWFPNSRPAPHVHLELCTEACPWGHPYGTLDGTEDPLSIAAGCLRPGRRYPTRKLVLSYPVRC